MKKLIFAIVLAAASSGCVLTTEYREVVVHKDADGKIIGTDYKEVLEQKDALPWQPGFGKYLFNQ